ncbi:MAG: GNAT family N-acetyltransferase [Chloroflexi bacterium]|nr:GNAT family N-acetyltransferase [Chloroflexota bacterium]
MTTLRRAARTDIDCLLGWIDSPMMLLYWSGTRFTYPLRRADLDAHFDLLNREAHRRRAYTLLCSGIPVGYGEIVMLAESTARLARVIIAPDARGRGLGRTLASALIERAFTQFGVRKTDLYVFRDNVAAIRCYRAVGMTVNGRLDKAYDLPGGQSGDLLRMVVHAEEWG